MKLEELRKKSDEVLDRRMKRFYSIRELSEIYKDLIKLKDEIINSSLIGLTIEEIEELDYIKFRMLEELYLVEIDIKEKSGLDTKIIQEKLEALYKINGGEIAHER